MITPACRAVALALLLAASAAHSANDAMDGVRQRLVDATLIRGEFQQTRRIAGFRNPLLSSGQFVLVAGRGVLWHTQRPFASTLVVTGTRLEQRNASGKITNQLDAGNQPALRAINDALLSLLTADAAGLRAHFSIAATLDDANGWTLSLVPRDALLARQLRAVRLQGDRLVREVELSEQGGDSTVIRFSALSAGGALQPDEAALLDATTH